MKCIGSKEFSWMKQNGLFINTARGNLVDEEALIHALQTRRIAGAALDVFAQEPLPTTHPLITLPNVILTPHMAWGGPWTLVNDAQTLLKGIARSLQETT
ncbi:NAD(P)-dependent oxidoreductase [Brevibacillus sp. SYP-B805]|uniref:NAD(P)-dependent oxidoreductase n=1 Tax=Brevibacillus sp. SYP-B805 TaxID=1578199 RepID=UPI0032169264